jgi:N-acetylglucosaminyldiphosphoundecaprenol N-acetyl-beta-D-mannosaminyltransferase
VNRADVFVAGVPIWLPDRGELLAAIAAQLSAPPGGVSPARLFTINPELAMLAARDPAYRAILARAEWNVVDGAGVACAIRLRARSATRAVRGRALRHPGADLIHDLAAAAAGAGRPLLLLGSTPVRASKACERLRREHPTLDARGISPPFSATLPFANQDEIEHVIAELRPGVVVACLGAPKQEQWIDRSTTCLQRADVRVVAGLGGTIDFLSGEIKRAPRPVRAIGCEWLFRLAVDPARSSRVIRTLPAFAVRALTDRGFVRVASRA